MARLNIEDPFWLDVIQLVAKTGDQDKAIGNAIRFFRFAQEKHKNGLMITDDEFKRLGFIEDLIPLFAERTPDGIRAVGAEKHFGWLVARVEAGRRGGLARNGGKREAAERREMRKKANAAVTLAIKSGSLVRSISCSECGSQGDIEAHHDDYSKPFEIRWLCTGCHGSEHSLTSNQQRAQANISKHQQPQPSPSYSSSSSYSSSNSLEIHSAVVKTTHRKQQVVEFNSHEELKAAIDKETLADWSKLYPDELYIEREIIKAFVHYRNAGRKKPTTIGGWKRVLGSWFERGWPRHVARIPDLPKPKETVEDIAERLIREHNERSGT